MSARPVLLIIQARMTSTRLPGKILLPVGGVPILEAMVRRLADLPFPHRIVVATTDDGSEAPILDLCGRLGAAAWRGPVDDVLARYLGAARSAGAEPDDPIVRLTSDCPLVCADVAARVVDRFRAGGCDYASNVVRRTFPRGLDTECFDMKTLTRLDREAAGAEREHVTLRALRRPADFRVAGVEDATDRSGFRLTVDEPDDLAAVRRVFDLAGSLRFGYDRLAAILDAHPEVRRINGAVEQKKV